jgi:hypothetical protein
MDEKNINPQESIDIINKAIKDARKETDDAYYYLLLWGILLVVFFILSFLASFTFPEHQKLIQSIAYLVFPVGGVWSFLHSRKSERTEKIKSIHENLYAYVWGGVGLCLGVWTLVTQFKGLESYVPVFILLFGFASFITGGVTKFYPSVFGGVVCVICAAVANISPVYQCLYGALGILAATVIPGFIMVFNKKPKNV